MLDSRGLITAPCGVPRSGVQYFALSITSCPRNASSRPKTLLSETWLLTRSISGGRGIVS